MLNFIAFLFTSFFKNRHSFSPLFCHYFSPVCIRFIVCFTVFFFTELQFFFNDFILQLTATTTVCSGSRSRTSCATSTASTSARSGEAGARRGSAASSRLCPPNSSKAAHSSLSSSRPRSNSRSFRKDKGNYCFYHQDSFSFFSLLPLTDFFNIPLRQASNYVQNIEICHSFIFQLSS